MVYLDNTSTTKIDHRVLDAMMPYLMRNYGNPGSPHKWGRMAVQAIDQARYNAAWLLERRSLHVCRFCVQKQRAGA